MAVLATRNAGVRCKQSDLPRHKIGAIRALRCLIGRAYPTKLDGPIKSLTGLYLALGCIITDRLFVQSAAVPKLDVCACRIDPWL
jgi:hypothetical protein